MNDATLLGLKPRSIQIFNALVAAYLESGQPIGSKTLAQRLRLDLSPASIRSNMSDLEQAGLLFAPHTGAAADAAGAERQYRVARRLAAEGSPDAAAALQKVIELDPEGRLADDALLEQALLEPLPRWPEGLGRIDADAARRALGLIDRLLTQVPRGDRVPEARSSSCTSPARPLIPGKGYCLHIESSNTPGEVHQCRAAKN